MYYLDVTTMTEATYQCGKCGAEFDNREDSSEHVQECDTNKCFSCDEEFDSLIESIKHNCPEKSPQDFPEDTEAQWRDQKRHEERAQKMDRKRLKEPGL